MKSSGLGRPRTLIIQLVLGVVLLLVVGATVTSSPGVCGRCHAALTASQAKTPHAGVGCYSCHLDSGPWGFMEAKGAEYFSMYPAAARGATVAGAVRPIGDSGCLQCHREVLTSGSVKGRIRIQHASCTTGATCVTCHSDAGHGASGRWPRKPDMAKCLACHRARNATVDCDVCHTGRSGEKRLLTGAWAITHGPNWESTHGMGDMRSCGACHPKDYCVRCHGTRLPHAEGFFRTHGTDATAKNAGCRTCHKTSFCDGCHGIPMPHPAGFRKAHSKAAKGPADASCLRCHRKEDCDACHAAHTHPGRTDGTMGTALPVTKGGAR